MRIAIAPLALMISITTPAFAHVDADVVPGQLLVKMPDAKSDADIATELGALPGAAVLGVHFERRSVFGWVVAHVDTTSAHDTLAAAALLATGKRVVEPVRIARTSRTPNDPELSKLWAFQMMDVDKVWDKTIGASSQRIGLVDSGINRNHIDLVAHDIGGFDFISDASGALDGDGRDADYGDSDFGDVFHGSHVAGTMLASANDGIGVPGLNWNAGLMTVRALSSDAGSETDIMEGASWLAGFHVDGVPDIGANRVSVINMSLGGPAGSTCDAFSQDVLSTIVNAGVVVVVAAGNDGNDVASTWPADCDGVIDVAAYGPTGDLAVYSNFDDRIDVVAPGGDSEAGFGEEGTILSVDGSTDDGYQFLEGTSMAAPHVSGVVSLMQAVNPRLSPRQIRDILAASPFGCSGKPALYAKDAVDQAASTTGELAPGSNASNGSSGSNGSNGSNASNGSGTCDEQRGNWDCTNGFGCVGGQCVKGAEGTVALGDYCEKDSECDSGLCDGYSCTKPCDGGCQDGFECDEHAIPGGMCRDTSESCSQSGSFGAPAAAVVLIAVWRRRRR